MVSRESKSEKVLVKDAWTEEVKEKVPKYVTITKSKCSYCGKDLTGLGIAAADHYEHCGEYYYNEYDDEWEYAGASMINYTETVQDGYEYETDYIEHPAEYKTNNYTSVTYRCSCGDSYTEKQ